jgi:tRNA/tmRNA/rRNA uracil-C5-methylase (TrmA/RlmC/RlmD family)
MSAQKLDITRLGGQGDGIAETPAGQIFVPFTVPGDVINAGVEKSRASLIAVLEPSPDRVNPPCPHFGPDEENAGCGGCALQHVADEAYRDWKRGLVVAALESRNIGPRLRRWCPVNHTPGGGWCLPRGAPTRARSSASTGRRAITSFTSRPAWSPRSGSTRRCRR